MLNNVPFDGVGNVLDLVNGETNCRSFFGGGPVPPADVVM
jgi:hypothetical protein